jgi:hypothetical protein
MLVRPTRLTDHSPAADTFLGMQQGTNACVHEHLCTIHLAAVLARLWVPQLLPVLAASNLSVLALMVVL